MKKLYIGLDVSTTTIGYSIICIENGKIFDLNYSYYKPNKKLSKIHMLSEAKKIVVEIIDGAAKIYELKPIVCIEDILIFTNKTTPTTVTTLAAINRLMCVHAFDNYQLNLLPVATIRATLKRMVDSKVRIEKDMVPNTIETIMQTHIKGWKFNYELISKGKSKGKPKQENYDSADGVAVALACAYKNKDI